MIWIALAFAGTARFDPASLPIPAEANSAENHAVANDPAGVATENPAVVNDPVAVAAVAADTLRLIDEVVPGTFAPGKQIPGLTSELVRATLQRISASASRLSDPAFLETCFTALRWTPDSDKWGGKIRLTRYLVYSVEGSDSPTPTHDFALYAVPNDETGLSLEAAQLSRDRLDRFRYTRQDIAGGVFRAGGRAEGRAKPLVWLTHNDHEQAILQGTTAVKSESGTRLFNVDRDNGFAYDRAETDTTKQRRTWYFRETDAVRGAGESGTTKVALQPGAAVAGDLENIGLGTVVALEAADGLHVAVVADTGGAFQPNLHQLDLYTGIFPSRSAFEAATGKVGDTATAYVLLAKPNVPECDSAP